MKVIVQLDYNTALLIPCEFADTAAQMIEKSTIVKEDGPYDAKFWVLQKEREIEMKFVPDSAVRIGESASDGALVETVLRLTKENSNNNTKIYTLEAELKKIKDAAGVK